MNITIQPTALTGAVLVPSSKSIGHRELICAALAKGQSIVDNVSLSQDIEATVDILRALGASIVPTASIYKDRQAYRIDGGLQQKEKPFTVSANESGSTLRFLLPVAVESGNTVTFTGKGRLAQRPLTPYYELFDEHGIFYETTEGALPITVRGAFTPGTYAMAGNVSSQFFSGLLFTLPLLDGPSTLVSTTPLESGSYVDMTLDCLSRHGISIEKERDGTYQIPGNQRYACGSYIVEGDYSQVAFWLVAAAIGAPITCQGLSMDSTQGDQAIVPILRDMGASIEERDGALFAVPSDLHGVTIDVEDCPDLVPALTVAAAFAQGTTHIIHAGRVRLKECDRLAAMATELNTLGAHITEEAEGLVIEGELPLMGGTVSGWNDHRIAMALAIAAQRCSGPVTITGAECVRKSYPLFWDDYETLGGHIERRFDHE